MKFYCHILNIKTNATIIHDEQCIQIFSQERLGPCVCTTGLIGFSVIPALLDPTFYLSSYPSS